jgi:hypothetical protein
MKIILFLWQLPQNLLGLLVILFSRAKKKNDYWISERIPSGISLGDFIILRKQGQSERVIKHEKGHQIQSKIFGPLYLFIIGLPSIFRNLWATFAIRVLNKDPVDVIHWYYSGYPEKWADILGKVKE